MSWVYKNLCFIDPLTFLGNPLSVGHFWWNSVHDCFFHISAESCTLNLLYVYGYSARLIKWVRNCSHGYLLRVSLSLSQAFDAVRLRVHVSKGNVMGEKSVRAAATNSTSQVVADTRFLMAVFFPYLIQNGSDIVVCGCLDESCLEHISRRCFHTTLSHARLWDYALNDFSLPHRQSRLRWLVLFFSKCFRDCFLPIKY